VVRIGKANDGVTTLVANGGQDAYQGEGVVIADVFVPMIYQGGQPSVVPVSHRMESGDAIVVEVCGGIDNAGAAFDIDTAVCINRRPTKSLRGHANGTVRTSYTPSCHAGDLQRGGHG
jgi:hypothetical protein